MYYIYLDKEKKNYIEIEADPDGWYIEPSGDFHYYLNREDFKETVYEIPMNFVTSGGYYFMKKNIAFWVYLEEDIICSMSI